MKLPEIPITPADLVAGVLCPAVVATAVLGLARLLPFRRREWAGPVAMALGFVAAYPLINGIAPKFPPNNAGDWLFWLALPIGIVAGATACFRLHSIFRSFIAAIVFGATLYLMMQPAVASRTPAEWWTLWAVLVAVLTADFWFADAAIQSDSTITSLIGFACILAGACVLIQMSGSLKYALQGGAVVAALVAAVVVATIGPGRSAVSGGAAMAGIGIVGCLLAVSIEPLFVNVTTTNALLIAAAPILLWAGRFIRLPKAPLWLRAGVRLLLPAIPVLIALAIAGAKAMADLNDSGSGYEGY